MELLRVTIFLAILVGLSSCIDEIELDSPVLPDSAYVVQGNVVGGENPSVSVLLERAFQFEGFNQPERVDLATIFVFNDVGDELELKFDTQVGNYTSRTGIGDFTIEVGRTYWVEITLRNGDKIFSSPSYMIDTPEPIASVIATQVEESGPLGTTLVDGLELQVSSSLEREGEPRQQKLRWQTFQSYRYTEVPTNSRYTGNDPRECYIVNRELESDVVRLIDGQTTTLDSLEDLPIATVALDFKQREGYVMTVMQESLEDSVFQYFEKIEEAITRDATLFEPPAGQIINNLRYVGVDKQKVYGYFYATDREYAHVYVEPRDDVQAFCPRPATGSPFPSPNGCDDCLQFGNAQLERPSFFP